ncbi:uncharacterized protein LOC127876069 isoform X2 [Dreissena polymorpha]|uniref:uncharacterized protein LOC127876069 isoform X2 n=1 Tax=Dreissena polymorpha TaxID=45954 RepID=UPI00226400DF|nr:uncharacterized protein LOC127876069 isoform X2 [Dreissena polymorpha]
MAETTPNLRDIFRKPSGSSHRAPVRQETAGEKYEPSTKKHREGPRRNAGHSNEPERSSNDDFMNIFKRTSLQQTGVTHENRNRTSTRRASSDDSEEDLGKKTQNEEDNPFMKLVADVKVPKNMQGNKDSSALRSTPQQPSSSLKEKTTQRSAGGLGGAHNDQLRPSLGAQSQASAATGSAPLNQSVSTLGAHNPGGAGIATSNPMSSLFGGHNLGSAVYVSSLQPGRGSAPSNQMAPFLGEQNLGSAGRGSSPANQVSPLLGAQNRGGAGGQNPMAQMQMLQQMLGGQGGQNPMAQMQMLQQMLGGQAGQDPMAQMNMLQQMMGGQGGDMMNMLSQAGRGRGRGMGMGRGSRLNDDEDIDIDNITDNDVIHQMLAWEAQRAQTIQLQNDPYGTTTVLLIDTSGSMAGDGILQAEEFLNTFMDGLEHQQKNLNMQENVAIITVGSSVEVTQHLTNNYPKIRETLHCLCAEGPSKLHFGLILPLSILPHLENGGIKDFGGHAAAPRVILISDGRITGQPDGPTLPDEREKMALQNVTLELLNSMIQTTLTQVFCIPVGQSDKGFLEFISNTTGGKNMDRKYARVLSRYHIYHTVVASLKQHQTEPTKDSIRHQLVTVAQTYDEDDVEEVMYMWRQPEPDIQGRNQRMAQQQEESGRRSHGGMPGNGRPATNYGQTQGLPGGHVGQGRGGGVPGLGGFGGQNPGMGGIPPGIRPSGRGVGGLSPVGRGQEIGLGGQGMGDRDLGLGGDFDGLRGSGGSAFQSSRIGFSRMLMGDDFGNSQRRQRLEEEAQRERDAQPKLPPEQLRLAKIPGPSRSYWPTKNQIKPWEIIDMSPGRIGMPGKDIGDSFQGWRIKHPKNLEQFEDEDPSDSNSSTDED